MSPSLVNGSNGSHTSHGHQNGTSTSLRSINKLFSCIGPVLITGGDGCIGLAIVEGLVQAGATHIISLQLDDNSRISDLIKPLGASCTVYVCDQRNPEAVDKIFPQILSDGHSPSVFVSCAGLQRRGSIADCSRQALEDLMQVNTMSQFVIARDFAAYRKKIMKASNLDLDSNRSNGKIIFIASMQSYTGGVNVTGYATSKAAVLGTVRAFSNEFAVYGIQTNCIAPGLVDTDFTASLKATPGYAEKALSRIPASRWGHPEDYKGAAIYLASAASNYMTGQAMVIDGGRLAF